MAGRSIESDLYLLGVVLVAVVGVLLIWLGQFADRSRGRPRCPECWCDMRGSLPKLECPECGHDADDERRLYQTRCHWWLIAPGYALLWAVLLAIASRSLWWKGPFL